MLLECFCGFLESPIFAPNNLQNNIYKPRTLNLPTIAVLRRGVAAESNVLSLPISKLIQLFKRYALKISIKGFLIQGVICISLLYTMLNMFMPFQGIFRGYLNGQLFIVLAPPAGYIPRHCRGTPLETLYLQLQNNMYFCRKILMYNHID